MREEIDFDPAAGRAGDHGRALLAELEGLQNLEADEDLFDRIGRERDADRVADAERQQRAEPDRGANRTRPRGARFGHAEVERIVVRQRGEAAVGLDHHRHFERLQADLDVEEVEIFENLDMPKRGAHHPFGAQLDLGGVLARPSRRRIPSASAGPSRS